MNTGSVLIGKPCLGSWLSYGLGTREREPAELRRDDRPARRADRRRLELDRRLHAGRLPGDAVPRPGHARCSTSPRPPGISRRRSSGTPRPAQAAQPRAPARRRPGETELAARIQSYELAYRMQTGAAEVVDLDRETREDARRCTASTTSAPRDFGRKCLMTRRLLEKRRPLRPALLRRRPPRGHLGRPQRLHRQPHAARRRDRPADRRPDRRPEAHAACGTRRC